MIELYLSISEAISKVPGIKWVDMGQRVEGHTVVYPAAFVQDIIFNPEETGNQQYYGEFTFTVIIYIKPYQSSVAKPKLETELAKSFEPVAAVRKAIYELDNETVQNTVWLRESIKVMGDGMYVVTQNWKGVAAVGM